MFLHILCGPNILLENGPQTILDDLVRSHYPDEVVTVATEVEPCMLLRYLSADVIPVSQPGMSKKDKKCYPERLLYRASHLTYFGRPVHDITQHFDEIYKILVSSQTRIQEYTVGRDKHFIGKADVAKILYTMHRLLASHSSSSDRGANNIFDELFSCTYKGIHIIRILCDLKVNINVIGTIKQFDQRSVNVLLPRGCVGTQSLVVVKQSDGKYKFGNCVKETLKRIKYFDMHDGFPDFNCVKHVFRKTYTPTTRFKVKKVKSIQRQADGVQINFVDGTVSQLQKQVYDDWNCSSTDFDYLYGELNNEIQQRQSSSDFYATEQYQPCFSIYEVVKVGVCT
jgi:hypothetical protein